MLKGTHHVVQTTPIASRRVLHAVRSRRQVAQVNLGPQTQDEATHRLVGVISGECQDRNLLGEPMDHGTDLRSSHTRRDCRVREIGHQPHTLVRRLHRPGHPNQGVRLRLQDRRESDV